MQRIPPFALVLVGLIRDVIDPDRCLGVARLMLRLLQIAADGGRHNDLFVLYYSI